MSESQPEDGPEHPETDRDRYRRRIEVLAPRVRPLVGNLFRACSYEWATRNDLLTGKGSASAGGRWNPIGLRVVYASIDPYTAVAEMMENNSRPGFGMPSRGGETIPHFKPIVLITVAIRLSRVLNLTDRAVREGLGISEDEIVSAPWKRLQAAGEEAATQAIGHTAASLGIQGLIVPTRLLPWNKGQNMVVFVDQVGSGDLNIVGNEMLPENRLIP